jgi:ribosome-binding factor A
MAYRKERLAHFIRDVVSDAIGNRLSDPRISHFTSVTRVELSADLTAANVYVSVMGTEQESRRTMQGLESARGMIQTRLARQLKLRQCPILRFELDMGLKAAIETIRQLKEVEAELAKGEAEKSEELGDGEECEEHPNAGEDDKENDDRV